MTQRYKRQQELLKKIKDRKADIENAAKLKEPRFTDMETKDAIQSTFNIRECKALRI